MNVRVAFILGWGVCGGVWADMEIKYYSPYSGESMQILKTMKGHCYGQSEKIKREDAWRCQTDTQTLDPCFSSMKQSNKVFCPVSPWTTQGILLEDVGVLDLVNQQKLDMSVTYPWAIELENGERCEAVHSGEMISGLPLLYRCSSGAFLVGYIQRCKPTWQILYKGKGELEKVTMKVVWF